MNIQIDFFSLVSMVDSFGTDDALSINIYISATNL